MTPEEWKAHVEAIAENASDPSKLTALLTQATDAFAEQFAKANGAAEKVKQLEEKVEGLQKANWEYFQRIGQQIVDSSVRQGKEKEEEKTRAETITIADLFKEDNNGN